MIYKKGDKVKIIDYKYLLYNFNVNTFIRTGKQVWYLKHGLVLNDEMAKYCGKILTISSVTIFNEATEHLYYTFEECKEDYCWSPQLIECFIE